MSEKNKLTHFNEQGEVHMVDVSEKQVTKRQAIAEGFISMQATTLSMIQKGEHKKGDVLSVARIAGIMGAKKTSELIPLCHPLMLTKVTIDFSVDENNNCIRCEVLTATSERTGVEMEALTAVQVGLLTIYDMCKAVDRGMVMHGVQLLHKSGGKSGEWHRDG